MNLFIRYILISFGNNLKTMNEKKMVKKTNGKKTIFGLIILLILGIINRIYPDFMDNELFLAIHDIILYGWVFLIGLVHKVIKWFRERWQ